MSRFVEETLAEYDALYPRHATRPAQDFAARKRAARVEDLAEALWRYPPPQCALQAADKSQEDMEAAVTMLSLRTVEYDPEHRWMAQQLEDIKSWEHEAQYAPQNLKGAANWAAVSMAPTAAQPMQSQYGLSQMTFDCQTPQPTSRGSKEPQSRGRSGPKKDSKKRSRERSASPTPLKKPKEAAGQYHSEEKLEPQQYRQRDLSPRRRELYDSLGIDKWEPAASPMAREDSGKGRYAEALPEEQDGESTVDEEDGSDRKSRWSASVASGARRYGPVE